MGSETDEKIKTSKTVACINRVKIVCYVLLLASPYLYMMFNYYSAIRNASKMNVVKIKDLKTIITQYEKCPTSFTSRTDNDKNNAKPVWVTHFPASLGINEDIVHKTLTGAVTGLKSSGKSFYTSLKRTKLKKCFDDGFSTTATCFNIHPIIAFKESPVTNKFFNKYVMVLRNPMTAMPSYYNWKQIKYHGVKGQVSEEDWKNHRDSYLKDMLDEWKSVIQIWKEMEPDLKPGMYLVYEYLMHPIFGPGQVEQYAGVLEQAGFDVESKKGIPCTWYNSIGRKETLLQFHLNSRYDFGDYMPSYTAEQRFIILEELENMVSEYREDLELVHILHMYINDIKAVAQID